MSMRAITSTAIVSALATTGVIAVAGSPAAADSDSQCLGDFNGFQVHDAEPLRSSSQTQFGTTFLYFNNSNLCAYAKTSTPNDLYSGESATAWLQKSNDPNRYGQSGVYLRTESCGFGAGSNSCLTPKVATGGTEYVRSRGEAITFLNGYVGYTDWY